MINQRNEKSMKYPHVPRGTAVVFAALSLLAFVPAGVAHASTVVFLTSGTSWTVPSDWNSSNNTIEVIGGGANGGTGSDGFGGGGAGAAGGGGGGYSKSSNVSLTSGGSVSYVVGGVSGDTYLCNSTSNCGSIGGSAVVVGAKGASGSTGGSSASGIGTVKYSGGSGGAGGYQPGYASGSGGGGGGGAAGLHGNGSNGSGGGAVTGSLSPGAGGGGGSGDAGNTSANTNGTQWDASHGSGGGGSGSAGGYAGGPSGPESGSSGGTYGAGGGGGGGGLVLYGGNSGGAGGAGRQGIIVITYTPSLPSSSRDLTVSKAVSVVGNVTVSSNITKGSGTFVIDHPLDPENKLLYHSFVESPDAKTVYVGRATLDEVGSAAIALPTYFLALNKDFRYFATPVGVAMPGLFLSVEVKRRFFGLFGTPIFSIAGGSPGGEVSWMVTGIRHDPYILANPITPVVKKSASAPYAQGMYVHPQLFAPSTPQK